MVSMSNRLCHFIAENPLVSLHPMQNVMFNFKCQFDCSTGCSDIWWNIILGVFVNFFFGVGDGFNIYTVRLNIDQIIVPNVDGLIQSVEGLSRTNGLTFSWMRGNSYLIIFKLGKASDSFPTSRLNLKHWVFLISELLVFRLELHH